MESREEGSFWKKAALIGAAGLGLVAGARMLVPPGPSEVVDVAEVSPNENVTPQGLRQEKMGIAAVSSDWIPEGTSPAYTTSPFGAARGTTERSPGKIFLDLHGSMEPDLTLTDLGEGKVEAYVDLPGPFDQKSVGTLQQEGEGLVYRSEDGSTSAVMKKTEDGTIEATLQREGWPGWNLSYRR